MSTVGGPKLAGIGPGAASDLVMCIDAHDAGSYPGEPTSNVFKHQADGDAVSWWGDGGNQAIGTKTGVGITDYSLKYNGYPTLLWTPGDSRNCYLNGTADIPDSEVSTAWTFSCYMRYEDGAAITSMSVYLYYPSSDGSASGTIVDVGNGWYRVSRSRTGSSDYISLAGFTGITAEKRIYLSGWQLEKKAYATPVVTGWKTRDSTEGVSGEVYDGRPATTNLMIHGNVGTGQSFYDSSPSKHTISVGGSVTHSTTQSKFGGGSFYFDGSSDELTIPTSDDWDFGTGDFTVDFWTYIESGAQDDTFFSTLPTGGSPVGINLSLRETEPFSLGAYSSAGYLGNGAAGNYTSRVISENTWYHIALVRTSGVLKFYVDGVNVGTVTGQDSLNFDTDQPFYMGRFYTDGTGYYLHGYMDEMRVTKGTALWMSAFTPPTRRNRSAPVVDLSGNHQGGNFATKEMTDVATYRDGQVIEPVASAVWDFDGTDDFINLGKMVDPAATIGTNGTMCLWINPAVVDTNDYIWSKNVASNGTSYIICKFTSNDYIQFRMYGNWAWGPQIYTGAISANTWTYIVCTWYTDGYAVYKDGVLADSAVESGTWGGAGSTEIWLGDNDSNDGGNPFQGKMGATALYKSSLSASQIKQNFNAQRSRFGV